MSKLKKQLLIALGIGVSIVFLWLSLRDTDFEEVWGTLKQANVWLAIPLVLAYFVFYWIKAYRWRLLLLPTKDATSRELFSPMMIGFMGNNILPAHLGEFIRMFLGAKQLKLSNSQVLATIILERIFDFMAVVFFLGVVLLMGRDVPEKLVLPGTIVACGGALALLVAATYAIWTHWFLRLARRLTFFLPDGLRHNIVGKLELGALGMHSLRRPGLAAAIVLTSILQWSLVGICCWLSMQAVEIKVPISAAFIVLAATTFGVTLPAAPGFVGTIQIAFTEALKPYGVQAASSFAASVFFHFFTYFFVTILGIILLKRMGYQLSQVQKQAEEAEQAIA